LTTLAERAEATHPGQRMGRSATCGEIMAMPSLPKVPATDSIDVDAQGKIVGLF